MVKDKLPEWYMNAAERRLRPTIEWEETHSGDEMIVYESADRTRAKVVSRTGVEYFTYDGEIDGFKRTGRGAISVRQAKELDARFGNGV